MPLILLCSPAIGSAQNTPEMREVLNRLDRLERENQALSEEVRSLRREVATLRPAIGAPAAEVAASPPGTAASDGAQEVQNAPGSQNVEDQLAVQKSRIEELAQTKVESSQKFPLRITGMALFNAYRNGRHNNETDNPTTASFQPGDVTGGATLRQTTLGLLYDGPLTLFGGKVSGSLFMDFFGGSTFSLNHAVRLRTAALNVNWANTSVMFGQDKPLISPRDPDSLAQVGVSPLTGAGNPWLWQPQVRVEQRVALSSDAGLRAQVAVFQTSVPNTSPADLNSYVPVPPSQSNATEYSSPGGEARLEFWRGWSETGRIEIAGGFHANRNHVGPVSVPSNVYSMDWFFRPLPKLELSGMFFHGRNVSVLGALRPGFTVLSNGRVIAVRSSGGWGQVRIPVSARVTFNFYGGQQDNRDSDLLYGVIGKNQAYFGNVMYRMAPNVIVSLEGGQVRTTFVRAGNRLNDHYDLAIAYLF